jgi:hypothetical protein
MNARRKSAIILFTAAAIFLVHRAGAQQQNPNSMPGMNMPDTNAPDKTTPDKNTDDMQHDVDQNPEAARVANDEMSGSSMNMNQHMFMTDLQPKSPGDDQRAAEIIDLLQKSLAKYTDYKVALADGYQIFLPKIPQPMYHFTNYRNAFQALFLFNPAHPTSLLYKKTATGYELIGAMFTAPKRATEQELDARVPLSVARWHEHVNLCMPPKGAPLLQADWKQFGLAGSIATQDACVKAGGRWIPQIFGWMVHVYPFETDPNKVWAH